eukprot:502839-Amphidinium_carterae.1
MVARRKVVHEVLLGWQRSALEAWMLKPKGCACKMTPKAVGDVATCFLESREPMTSGVRSAPTSVPTNNPFAGAASKSKLA